MSRNSIMIKVFGFWLIFELLLMLLAAAPITTTPFLNTFLFALILSAVSYLAIVYLVKQENATLADVGLRWRNLSLRRLGMGTLAGMVVVSIMIGVLWSFSSITIEPNSSPDYWDAIIVSVAIIFMLALMEEIVFRSYPFMRLLGCLGPRLTIYVSSIVFAFYHGLDPMNLLGPGVWGLFFGLAALKTGGIAFPLGLHFGLNWMQALFSLKLQYASGFWVITPTPNEAVVTHGTIGIGMQIILAVVALVMIELHLRPSSVQTSVYPSN